MPLTKLPYNQNIPSLPPTGIPLDPKERKVEGHPGLDFLKAWPYLKYVDKSERTEFLKLSQQEQTRELLIENLKLVVELAIPKVVEGVGKVVSPVFKRFFPKTVAASKKIVEATPIVKDRIEAAAITMKGGRVITGKSHGEAFEKIPLKERPLIDDADAFITESGIPLTRQQAVEMAGEIHGAESVITEDAAQLVGKTIAEPKLPKYAGSVNLKRQNIPVDLKLAEIRAEDGLKKKTLKWTEVDIQSANILDDTQKTATILEKARKGTALNPLEHDVIRKLNVKELYDFQASMQSAKGSVEAAEIFNSYKESFFIPTSKAARQAGQTLNLYRKEIGAHRLGQAFKKLNRDLNSREMKEFVDLDLDNPDQVRSFMNRLGDPKIMDYVYEYWYNSILSGIPTHVVNVASNTAWRSFQVPHRGLVGGIDRLINTFTGKARTRYSNEMFPMMAGFLTGKKKAARHGFDMLRHGRLTDFETKWAQEMGSSIGAFDRSASPFVRGVGKVITTPTKALRTMDVYANSLAYDGQLNALAKRAWNSGGKKGSYKKFQKNFVADPPITAHESAMKFAKYTTFMSDPGEFSRWIMKGRDVVPGGRFLVPFVNTIGNLLKRGVEMTPGVGLALSRGQNPSEVIAKQLEGALIAALIYKKIDGDEITGAAPRDRAANEAFYRQGKKAWAMKVGDNWYQYRRIEPYNTVIASSVIAHDNIKKALSEGNDEDASKHFYNMVNDFKNNLIDSSYLQGMSQIFDRYGTATQAPKRLASSMVPFSGFWRSINRSYEAFSEGNAKYRPSDTWAGAFAGVIPGLYNQVNPEIDVWGKEINLEGGVFRQWLPYKFSKQTEDKTELFLEKLGVYPGLPSQSVTHKGIKLRLDDDIYRNFIIRVGNDAKKIIDIKVDHIWGRAISNEKHHNSLKKKVSSVMDRQRNKWRKRAIKEQLNRLEE